MAVVRPGGFEVSMRTYSWSARTASSAVRAQSTSCAASGRGAIPTDRTSASRRHRLLMATSQALLITRCDNPPRSLRRQALDIVLNRKGGVPVRDQLVAQLELKILGGEFAAGPAPAQRPLPGAAAEGPPQHRLRRLPGPGGLGPRRAAARGGRLRPAQRGHRPSRRRAAWTR